MCRRTMTANYTAHLESIDNMDDVSVAHITVREDGEWLGDFFTGFERTQIGGKTIYAADWSTIRFGNGLYYGEKPPFWPVEEVAEELNGHDYDREFAALNTGPEDK